MTRSDRILAHLALPASSPALFAAVTAIPVEAVGCRNRGLLALAVVVPSLLVSMGAALAGLKERLAGQPGTGWWIVTSVVLAIPAVALLLLG